MRASAPKTPSRRLYIFAVLLFVWISAICFRLVRLQVVKFGFFEDLAERQRTRTVPVEPRRGNIYDRNGYPLAMSIDVDSVFAVPSEVHDQETTAAMLGKVLNLDPQDILVRLKIARPFVFIARKIDAETATRIRELNLRGIGFRKEPKRFYPKRELAAQVLGYVGMDDEGLGGLEREFDDDLRGIPGQELISLDARRKWFSRVERPPDPGQNLVLTIDQTIQYIAESELQQGMEDTKAIAGTVVVENPRTGEILALANRPTFNPNVFNSVPAEALKNRAVSDIYEPGSVFKIVTYSAAIDQHVVTPDDKVDCQHGSIDVFGMKIHDHESLGVVTIAEALAHSSDVAAIKVGMKLGDQRLYHYIHDYGFGQQTGIELPGETRGLAKPVSRWSKVSIGAISMGQEIGVTPLQTISLVSTIANDGVYTPPRIVAGELPPDGNALPVVFHSAQQHRVVSTMTAAADEEDDGRRGALRHGPAGHPRRLHRCRQNRHRAEGRPRDRRLLQDQVCRVVYRLRAGEQSGNHHRRDSRFADRTAPGRPGFARRCLSALPSRCSNTCTCRTMWTLRIRSGRTCWPRPRMTTWPMNRPIGLVLRCRGRRGCGRQQRKAPDDSATAVASAKPAGNLIQTSFQQPPPRHCSQPNLRLERS